MLTSTFCHIPGLGAHTEKSLWQQGCRTWSLFLDQPDEWNVGGAPRGLMTDLIKMSQDALHEGRHQFFAEHLGAKNAWRTWPEFRSRSVCLDIETDGGMRGESITMVGLYGGGEFTCLTRHEGLGAFPNLISNYSLIVTFFGAGFDIPMLKRRFPRLTFDHIHLDLCHAFRQVGVKGGLKKIERQMGLSRVDEAEGLDGRDAIRLYRLFEMTGDEEPLRVLTAYNREDVVNLDTLAEICWKRLRASTLADAGLTPSEF